MVFKSVIELCKVYPITNTEWDMQIDPNELAFWREIDGFCDGIYTLDAWNRTFPNDNDWVYHGDWTNPQLQPYYTRTTTVDEQTVKFYMSFIPDCYTQIE